jgi:hypothetical protein
MSSDSHVRFFLLYDDPLFHQDSFFLVLLSVHFLVFLFYLLASLLESFRFMMMWTFMESIRIGN